MKDISGVNGIAYRDNGEIKLNPPERIVPQKLLEQECRCGAICRQKQKTSRLLASELRNPIFSSPHDRILKDEIHDVSGCVLCLVFLICSEWSSKKMSYGFSDAFHAS